MRADRPLSPSGAWQLRAVRWIAVADAAVGTGRVERERHAARAAVRCIDRMLAEEAKRPARRGGFWERRRADWEQTRAECVDRGVLGIPVRTWTCPACRQPTPRGCCCAHDGVWYYESAEARAQLSEAVNEVKMALHLALRRAGRGREEGADGE